MKILITAAFMVATAIVSVAATVYAVQEDVPDPVGLVQVGDMVVSINGHEFQTVFYGIIGTSATLQYVLHPDDGRVVAIAVQVGPRTFSEIWRDPTFNLEQYVGPPTTPFEEV